MRFIVVVVRVADFQCKKSAPSTSQDDLLPDTSAMPVSSRCICPAESMKRTVKTFPSSRFACQSIPPAGAIMAVWGRVSGSAMLLGKVVRTFGQGLISRRRPCPPEWALSSVEAILNGQGLYEKNRPCPKRLQTLPDMPEEMAHFHGPTVTCPQTKTPRMAARRLERKTRLELFLVIY